MNLEEIRAQYPQYDDLSDMELARALHGQFYSDMDFNDFAERIGLQVSPPPSAPIPEGNALGDFIATFGNSAALGIPRMLSNTVGSGELDARLDFLEENNPGTSRLVGLGGSAVTGGLAGRAALRGLVNSGRVASPANPHALRIATSSGPGAARTAGQGLLNMITSKPGAAGGGLAVGSLLERLLGG